MSYVKKFDELDYGVFYWDTDQEARLKRLRNRQLRMISARLVVLAAGSLGTSNILFRSQKLGDLTLSPTLGHRLSLNAGSLLNLEPCRDSKVETAASGPVARQMSLVKKTHSKDSHHLWLCQWTLAQPLATICRLAQSASSLVSGPSNQGRLSEQLWSGVRHLWSWLPHRIETLQASFSLGTDRAGGRLHLPFNQISKSSLARAQVNLIWPALKYESYREKIQQISKDSSNTDVDQDEAALSVDLKPFSWFPSGACSMADDPNRGVVNDRCQVFNPTQAGKDLENPPVHTGLYICDGSVLPASLGYAPALTIAALSERAMAQIGEKHATVKTRTSNTDPQTPAIVFDEVMLGYLSAQGFDHTSAFTMGRRAGSQAQLKLVLRLRKQKSHYQILWAELQCDLFAARRIHSIRGRLHAKDENKLSETSLHLNLMIGKRPYKLVAHYSSQARQVLGRDGLVVDLIDESLTDRQQHYKGIVYRELTSGLNSKLSSLQFEQGVSWRKKMGEVSKIINISDYLGSFKREPRIPTEQLPLRALMDCKESRFCLKTSDQFKINLLRLEPYNPAKVEVVLFDDLLANNDLFFAGETDSLVNLLLAEGVGVTVFESRIHNHYLLESARKGQSFDHVAMYDLPAVIGSLRSIIKADHRLYLFSRELAAMVSFHALVSGLLPELDGLILLNRSLSVEDELDWFESNYQISEKLRRQQKRRGLSNFHRQWRMICHQQSMTRFHRRPQDGFAKLVTSSKRAAVANKTPCLLLSTEDATAFGNQRESFAFLDAYTTGVYDYSLIEGAHGQDIFLELAFCKQLVNRLFEFFDQHSIGRSRRRSG